MWIIDSFDAVAPRVEEMLPANRGSRNRCLTMKGVDAWMRILEKSGAQWQSSSGFVRLDPWGLCGFPNWTSCGEFDHGVAVAHVHNTWDLGINGITKAVLWTNLNTLSDFPPRMKFQIGELFSADRHRVVLAAELPLCHVRPIAAGSPDGPGYITGVPGGYKKYCGIGCAAGAVGAETTDVGIVGVKRWGRRCGGPFEIARRFQDPGQEERERVRSQRDSEGASRGCRSVNGGPGVGRLIRPSGWIFIFWEPQFWGLESGLSDFCEPPDIHKMLSELHGRLSCLPNIKLPEADMGLVG
ncbi:hypothetical protein FB451DRAFT_1171671 [Mycena latifolia]|nr:hypothetical protein FB451DRAFT_1171671 [Mycena latifolia]